MVPVDLDMLSSVRESDRNGSTGGYLDIRSGEVFDDSLIGPAMVGAGVAVDVEAEPECWLRFENIGSRAGRNDMAAFAGRQRDAALRERLNDAAEGQGAFRRFRDLVDSEGLTSDWAAFATDRRLGRARELLAHKGIRVG